MAVSKNPKVRLGSLVAPSGERTQSVGETLDLLHTHFPGSGAVKEASFNFSRTTRLDWQVATKDGIFPVLLQEGREVLDPYLVRIFRACLATGYVPTAWRQVKVVFIPKPGRDTYGGPKDYTPISLTSFLLKTMKRLVDRFIKDEMLISSPLHPNQHEYQPGEFTETALHQLVV
jgi:hypothetical protein